MPKAAPSTRSSGHITLSFGLVSIPMTVFSGTVATAGVERHEYLPVEVTNPDGTKVVEDHLIGRGNIDKTTGALLTDEEKAKVVKKVETDLGPVFVEDCEIEKLFTLDPDTFSIKEFQPQHFFSQGQYVPKDLKFLEPAKDKKKKHMPLAVKLFGTLLKGMREEGVIAVGELTTRGVPKPAIMTPDGVLWLVYHTDALREQRELPEADLVDGEVQMMRSLIGQLTTTTVSDLSDVRSELIQNFANEKAESGEFGQTADTYTPAAPTAPALDLSALLSASLDAAKAAS